MTQPQPSSAALIIKQEDPSLPDVVTLLRNGDANSAKLYPAESNHHLPLDALRRSDVRFLVARDAGGKAVATGAVVLGDGWAEIKRMWVEEDARGRGIAHRILDALIDETREAGIGILRLETGAVSHAALTLYEKAGFLRREAFADYGPDPLSVFMEKPL